MNQSFKIDLKGTVCEGAFHVTFTVATSAVIVFSGIFACNCVVTFVDR
jgi:hypothetical protein